MARLGFLSQREKRLFENDPKFKYRETKLYLGASDFVTMKLNLAV